MNCNPYYELKHHYWQVTHKFSPYLYQCSNLDQQSILLRTIDPTSLHFEAALVDSNEFENVNNKGNTAIKQRRNSEQRELSLHQVIQIPVHLQQRSQQPLQTHSKLFHQRKQLEKLENLQRNDRNFFFVLQADDDDYHGSKTALPLVVIDARVIHQYSPSIPPSIPLFFNCLSSTRQHHTNGNNCDDLGENDDEHDYDHVRHHDKEPDENEEASIVRAISPIIGNWNEDDEDMSSSMNESNNWEKLNMAVMMMNDDNCGDSGGDIDPDSLSTSLSSLRRKQREEEEEGKEGTNKQDCMRDTLDAMKRTVEEPMNLSEEYPILSHSPSSLSSFYILEQSNESDGDAMEDNAEIRVHEEEGETVAAVGNSKREGIHEFVHFTKSMDQMRRAIQVLEDMALDLEFDYSTSPEELQSQRLETVTTMKRQLEQEYESRMSSLLHCNK